MSGTTNEIKATTLKQIHDVKSGGTSEENLQRPTGDKKDQEEVCEGNIVQLSDEDLERIAQKENTIVYRSVDPTDDDDDGGDGGDTKVAKKKVLLQPPELKKKIDSLWNQYKELKLQYGYFYYDHELKNLKQKYYQPTTKPPSASTSSSLALKVKSPKREMTKRTPPKFKKLTHSNEIALKKYMTSACPASSVWKEFEVSYPLIFSTILSRETTQVTVNKIHRLIDARQRGEQWNSAKRNLLD